MSVARPIRMIRSQSGKGEKTEIDEMSETERKDVVRGWALIGVILWCMVMVRLVVQDTVALYWILEGSLFLLLVAQLYQFIFSEKF